VASRADFARVVFVVVAIGALLLTGCGGGAQRVEPKRVVLEPRIVGCSGSGAGCSSGGEALMHRFAREAKKHLCPPDKRTLLVKTDGSLVCVSGLPSAVGKTDLIGIPPPSSVRAGGPGAVREFTAGRVVAAASGCLACHRIGDAGNSGPGSELTDVGSRLPARAIERALVKSPAPMPSFSRLPAGKRRALVYFLARLR